MPQQIELEFSRDILLTTLGGSGNYLMMAIRNRYLLPLFLLIPACTFYEGDGEPPAYQPGLDGDLVDYTDASPVQDDASSPWPDASSPWPDASPVSDSGPLEDCSAITQEAICVVTAECRPFYAGLGCSCDAMGCECQDWQFEVCGY